MLASPIILTVFVYDLQAFYHVYCFAIFLYHPIFLNGKQ